MVKITLMISFLAGDDTRKSYNVMLRSLQEESKLSHKYMLADI